MRILSALKARVYDKKEKRYIMDAIRLAYTDKLKGEKMITPMKKPTHPASSGSSLLGRTRMALMPIREIISSSDRR